ncbi:hypothetical protein BJ742DRAFT_738231 [Cladochytrium replicatum]|nr:hypothetical protein BJ742DRAFT_738231 [Cladochytrium replicatum]
MTILVTFGLGRELGAGKRHETLVSDTVKFPSSNADVGSIAYVWVGPPSSKVFEIVAIEISIRYWLHKTETKLEDEDVGMEDADEDHNDDNDDEDEDEEGDGIAGIKAAISRHRRKWVELFETGKTFMIGGTNDPIDTEKMVYLHIRLRQEFASVDQKKSTKKTQKPNGKVQK